MPARTDSKRMVVLPDERLDAARRTLLADWCRLVGRRLTGESAAAPADPAAAIAALDLPPRVGQTLAGLLAGQSEKQIARHLSISPHTVHTYVKQLHKRLNVSSRGELLSRFVGGAAGLSATQS